MHAISDTCNFQALKTSTRSFTKEKGQLKVVCSRG